MGSTCHLISPSSASAQAISSCNRTTTARCQSETPSQQSAFSSSPYLHSESFSASCSFQSNESLAGFLLQSWRKYEGALAVRLHLSHRSAGRRTRRGSSSRCQSARSSIAVDPKDLAAQERSAPEDQGYTVVMKFGGSSLASAERMREVAGLIQSFPEERPVVVLSAMGKTTNNLLKAGDVAVSCEAGRCRDIAELQVVKDLHLKTAEELGVDASVVSELLDELQQLLTGIALMKELTVRTKDYLVSFGERMSTRLFCAYLNTLGVKARQYDSFSMGFVTTDEFTNADILEATYSGVAERLNSDCREDPAMAVVTGFLGKGQKTGAITTLGRGGSDLTATVIGRALGLREIQVWKDVDGVLTCDPGICPHAQSVPFLTFDEAAELAYFGAQVLHPQSMRPAREANIPVRVKNSYNAAAPGTLISATRDMSEALLTSIVLKPNVTLLDIVSLRMLGQYGFLAKVFAIFEQLGISVDVVATSEVSLSLTLDPAKMWSRELIKQELDRMEERLREIAVVKLLQRRSIISLIGNVQRSSIILEKAFSVLGACGTNVQMISQGASKVNISLVVDDAEAQELVQRLHCEFFEKPMAASQVQRKEGVANGHATNGTYQGNGHI